jgi:hypothetical protein
MKNMVSKTQNFRADLKFNYTGFENSRNGFMQKTLKNGTKIKKFHNWQICLKKYLAAFFISYSTIQRKNGPVSNFNDRFWPKYSVFTYNTMYEIFCLWLFCILTLQKIATMTKNNKSSKNSMTL